MTRAKKAKTKTKTKVRRRPALPKKFRGATVIRGLGMDAAKYDALIDSEATAEFDATGEMWIVVEDQALRGHFPDTQIRGFLDKVAAIRCARANGNGNVDQRVLRVTEQVLVVATENDL